MSSLFGNNTATQSTGTGLFGSSSTNNQQTTSTAGTGLFGSNTTQNQPTATGGLFGASSTNQTGGGLFGGGNTQQQQQQQGGSLFGNLGNNNTNTNTNTQAQPSLFGNLNNNSNANTQAQPSLFANLNNNNSTATNGQAQPSLFGGNTSTQPQQQQAGSSLFGGNNNNNTTAPTTSLFGGASQTNNANPTSLFPNSQPQSQPQQNPLFAPSAPSATQPPEMHLSALLQQNLGASTNYQQPTSYTLASSTSHDLARSRLEASNIHAQPNSKPLPLQIQTLIRKWDPQSSDTVLKSWLYNAVQASYAPFYYRNVSAGEEEEEWERALAAKPAPITPSPEDGAGGGGESVSFVPVLVRGFHALGQRVEYQARTVNEMRARLHEMNNSLDSVMALHSQNLTIRLANARRQHVALAQRCLRLAIKSQGLRMRGFPLDAQEESLRRLLGGLEGEVFNSGLEAREEEVWARLLVLRERGRWLEVEGKRLGQDTDAVAASQGTGGGAAGGISEEVLRKTRGILRDYDGQIEVLRRELGDVEREFAELRKGR